MQRFQGALRLDSPNLLDGERALLSDDPPPTVVGDCAINVEVSRDVVADDQELRRRKRESNSGQAVIRIRSPQQDRTISGVKAIGSEDLPGPGLKP
jgi:hypothetical protein